MAGSSQNKTAVFPAVRTTAQIKCRPKYNWLTDSTAERFIVIRERIIIPIFMLISSSEILYRSVVCLMNSTVHAHPAAIHSTVLRIPRVSISAAVTSAAQIIVIIRINALFFIVL